jgi:hypothetical protein
MIALNTQTHLAAREVGWIASAVERMIRAVPEGLRPGSVCEKLGVQGPVAQLDRATPS